MIDSSFFRRLIIAVPFMLLVVISSYAETATKDKSVAFTDTLNAQLDQVEAALNRENLSDDAFNKLRAQLVTIQQEATSQQEEIKPSLEEATARLDTLKPAEVKEGEEPNAEAQALITKRGELEAQVAELDGQLKLIKASQVRANQLDNKITLARQDRFTQQLFGQTGTIFNPDLWLQGITGLFATAGVLATLLSDWGAFLSVKAADKAWQIGAMIVFTALIIIGPLRYLLFTGLSRLARLKSPTPLQRSLHASWALFAYTFVPVSIFLAFTLVLRNANLLPTRIDTLATELAFVLFGISLSYGLIRVLLAPKKPDYRLLNISDGDSIKLYGIAMILLMIFAIKSVFDKTKDTLIIPLETTILISGIAAILIAILIWSGHRMIISAETLHPTHKTRDGELAQDGFTLPGFLKFLRALVWLACIVVGLAPILGYVSLGAFLAAQIGRTFVILGILGILSALIDNFLVDSLESTDGRMHKVSQAMGIAPKAVNQFGVMFNGVLRILLYVGAALLIFAPWGVQSTDFLTSLKNSIFGFQIGDLSISPINILGALLVFIVTIVLVKSVQRWMERRLMPATDLDTGLKNSIQTSVGYVGFILAAMLAFSYMGVNLSNIALVAGALSVGIGFGLQSIVNNFVSGLILLVERPIKTGDWVVVGADQGYVKKISVRATKIETFDRATVIVPNSDLISNRVMNWMHNGSMGRIIIPIGVSYDSDPEQVKAILLKVAQDCEHVAAYPGPNVYFMDFGASSLDFELRCYIQDINSALTAKSALRFDLFRALKQANVEIPFPQQDIYVRSVASPQTQEQKNAEETAKAEREDFKATPHRLEKDEVELDDGSSDDPT